MSVKQYVQVVEQCICEIASEFQKLAFNSYNERDLQCSLFSRLRAKEELHVSSPDGNIELVHTEFPVLWENNEVGKNYDLVLWHPRNALRYTSCWDKPPKEAARCIPVLIAIEVKHLYGRWKKINSLSSPSKIMRHNDIRKLTKGRNRYGYFLAFSDEDIKEDKQCHLYFEKMRKGFEEAVKRVGSRLRVLCISKDGCEIRLGFSTKQP